MISKIQDKEDRKKDKSLVKDKKRAEKTLKDQYKKSRSIDDYERFIYAAEIFQEGHTKGLRSWLGTGVVYGEFEDKSLETDIEQAHEEIRKLRIKEQEDKERIAKKQDEMKKKKSDAATKKEEMQLIKQYMPIVSLSENGKLNEKRNRLRNIKNMQVLKGQAEVFRSGGYFGTAHSDFEQINIEKVSKNKLKSLDEMIDNLENWIDELQELEEKDNEIEERIKEERKEKIVRKQMRRNKKLNTIDLTDDDEDDVVVGDTISLEDRLRINQKKAEEAGEVIDLSSDDEDDVVVGDTISLEDRLRINQKKAEEAGEVIDLSSDDEEAGEVVDPSQEDQDVVHDPVSFHKMLDDHHDQIEEVLDEPHQDDTDMLSDNLQAEKCGDYNSKKWGNDWKERKVSCLAHQPRGSCKFNMSNKKCSKKK